MADTNWMEFLRVEGVVGQLETTLFVAHLHTMTADEKGLLCKLILHEPTATAHRLYRAVSLLLSDGASSEDVSNAIGKIVRILDPAMFRGDDRWWSVVVAFKQFDELTYAESIN